MEKSRSHFTSHFQVKVQGASLFSPCSSQPFIKLIYDGKVCKSARAHGPHDALQWTFSPSFVLTTCSKLHVLLVQSWLFFAERELGRCTVNLSEAKAFSEPWTLISAHGEAVGRLVLSIDLKNGHQVRTSCSTHCSANSWDSRTGFFLEGDEGLASAEACLEDEQKRLDGQRAKLLEVFKCIEARIKALQDEQRECKKYREKIESRENQVVEMKKQVRVERGLVQVERLALEKDRARLNEEFQKMQLEKLKQHTRGKLLEKKLRKIEQEQRKNRVEIVQL